MAADYLRVRLKQPVTLTRSVRSRREGLGAMVAGPLPLGRGNLAEGAVETTQPRPGLKSPEAPAYSVAVAAAEAVGHQQRPRHLLLGPRVGYHCTAAPAAPAEEAHPKQALPPLLSAARVPLVPPMTQNEEVPVATAETEPKEPRAPPLLTAAPGCFRVVAAAVVVVPWPLRRGRRRRARAEKAETRY